MGMGRPAYARGQGSFFGGRPPLMRNPTPYFPSRVGGLSGFFGGLAGGSLPMVNKPPPFMPQQPMPQMPMPPMNQPQTPSGGGFLAQLASSPMMQRPMPGGPGKGRSRGRRPMPGGPGKGRSQPQMPMPQQPFMGRVGNNMPQPPFMGRVGNNMPQLRTTTFIPRRNMEFSQPTARPNQTMGRPMPQPNFTLGPIMNQFAPQNRGGFYSGGITDLY